MELINWSDHTFWNHVIDIGIYVVLCGVLIVAMAELSFRKRR